MHVTSDTVHDLAANNAMNHVPYMSSRVSRSLREGGIVRTRTDSFAAFAEAEETLPSDAVAISDDETTRSTKRLIVS